MRCDVKESNFPREYAENELRERYFLSEKEAFAMREVKRN